VYIVFKPLYRVPKSCSWILYLLGLFGLGSISVYISWNVPCQPSSESWHPGTIPFLFELLFCGSYLYRKVFLISNILFKFLCFPLFMKIGFFVFQLALFILVAGILCIYINYDCDRQRQEFRRTNGKSLVWGKAPSKVKMHRIYWITICHLECTFYFLYNASQIGNLIVVRLT
jgi:predicted membrane protein